MPGNQRNCDADKHCPAYLSGQSALKDLSTKEDLGCVRPQLHHVRLQESAANHEENLSDDWSISIGMASLYNGQTELKTKMVIVNLIIEEHLILITDVAIRQRPCQQLVENNSCEEKKLTI